MRCAIGIIEAKPLRASRVTALAIADSSKAISLNPTYANAYINRGLAYYYQGNYQQAIANYNKAIELASSPHSAGWR